MPVREAIRGLALGGLRLRPEDLEALSQMIVLGHFLPAVDWRADAGVGEARLRYIGSQPIIRVSVCLGRPAAAMSTTARAERVSVEGGGNKLRGWPGASPTHLERRRWLGARARERDDGDGGNGGNVVHPDVVCCPLGGVVVRAREGSGCVCVWRSLQL
jgi:hypothetical protein